MKVLNFQQARGKLFHCYNTGFEKTRYAPHHRLSGGASPQGEALKKADNFQRTRGSLYYCYNTGYEKTRCAPHQSTTLTASPQGEAFFAYIYLCYTILLLIFVKISSSTRYYSLTLIIFSIINFYNMFIGAKNVDSRNNTSHKPDANRSKFVRT